MTVHLLHCCCTFDEEMKDLKDETTTSIEHAKINKNLMISILCVIAIARKVFTLQ